MSFTPRTRLVNPRLGTYFGIFTSAFAALVLLALIFEQLGTPEDILRGFMLVGPLVMLAAIGFAANTREPLEYFAAGRRVPAVYCGLGVASTALGATGIVGLTGALFLIGFDALCIINGVLAGFVVMAVLLAPFLRKFGSYTVPTYLARRFDSRALRITAAALLAIPTLLFLTAEIAVGAKAAAWLTGQPEIIVAAFIGIAVVFSIALGGMRALTWTNVAAGIAAVLALLVPVIIIAVMQGYLPLPQLSHGPVLRSVGRQEAIQALPVIIEAPLAFGLPADGMQIISKRFAEPFGSVGPLAYVLAMLTIMAGVAAAPWLLPRVATAPGVYEARKSLGWATFFFGLIMLTTATVAVFMRDYLMEVPGTSIAAPPDWLRYVIGERFGEISTRGTQLVLTGVAFDRDSILLALPVAGGLPFVIAYLAAAGIIMAATAAAAATALALSNLLVEDIVNGLNWKPLPENMRLNAGRVLLAVVVAFAVLIATAIPSDPLKLLLWSLAICGATAFPVLVASIWWKRVNVFGAFASMVTGFVSAVLVIVSNEAGVSDLASPLAGIVALPASIIAVITVSYVTLPPSRHSLELVRDIRIPGGEILYDREMRLLRLKERKRV